jgi:hypothetical protein
LQTRAYSVITCIIKISNTIPRQGTHSVEYPDSSPRLRRCLRLPNPVCSSMPAGFSSYTNKPRTNTSLAPIRTFVEQYSFRPRNIQCRNRGCQCYFSICFESIHSNFEPCANRHLREPALYSRTSCTSSLAAQQASKLIHRLLRVPIIAILADGSRIASIVGKPREMVADVYQSLPHSLYLDLWVVVDLGDGELQCAQSNPGRFEKSGVSWHRFNSSS